MKNIPLPSEKNFKIELLNSIHSLDSRMRWRAFHYLNPQAPKNGKETYGLNTSNTPPPIKELKTFQTGLCDIAKNLKFRNIKETFQKKLKDDLKDIQNEKKVIVAADKSRNFYKMEKVKYSELLGNSITKDYKIAEEETIKDIEKNDKQVAASLEVEERMFRTSKRDAFITIKDHKPNFVNNTKCRLINPTKSELGRVSKQMLAQIVSTVKRKSQLQQWRNTHSVIEWFTKLNNKEKLHFIQFDVVNYYASITPTLVKNSIAFAARYVNISASEKQLPSL